MPYISVLARGNNIFRFKQFEVDQTDCAMKINTDGTLLGVLSNGADPKSILDIGTGTGVVALMLAQRFPLARVTAVEIEPEAAFRARTNFYNSIFSDRLNVASVSFQQFSAEHPEAHFDMIVSNPPFFINSLKSTGRQKQTARHTDNNFFTELVQFVSRHLSPQGNASFILPLPTAETLEEPAEKAGLYISGQINIKSFADSATHRVIVSLGREPLSLVSSDFIIYANQKVYSEHFVNKLKDFFTIL